MVNHYWVSKLATEQTDTHTHTQDKWTKFIEPLPSTQQQPHSNRNQSIIDWIIKKNSMIMSKQIVGNKIFSPSWLLRYSWFDVVSKLYSNLIKFFQYLIFFRWIFFPLHKISITPKHQISHQAKIETSFWFVRQLNNKKIKWTGLIMRMNIWLISHYDPNSIHSVRVDVI